MELKVQHSTWQPSLSVKKSLKKYITAIFQLLSINVLPINTEHKDFLHRKHHWVFSSVQSLSRVRLCNPMNCSMPGLPVHHQLPESLKLTSIELVMPSSHLILGRPLLFLPPIPPSIRVFSNESAPRMRWPKYWSFSFSIIHSNEYPGLISSGYYHSLIFTHLC